MLEPAVVLLRFVQYSGAMVLFGSSLFLLYAFRNAETGFAERLRWPKQLLGAGAFALLLGSLVGLVAQTAVMAGSLTEGLKPASLGFVAAGTGLGRASLVRAASAALALIIVAALAPRRVLWVLAAALGAIACGSLAWMGHGAATEGPAGPVHLLSDVLHALAAAIWIGALAGFAALLWSKRLSEQDQSAAYHALHGFSGVGSVVVAALVVTGAINSWFLIGPTRLEGLWTTPYGQALSAKLVLVAAMVALAAANRFRLTPGLGRALAIGGDPSDVAATLRRSILTETTVGGLVLALVAWLGTLVPIAAQ